MSKQSSSAPSCDPDTLTSGGVTMDQFNRLENSVSQIFNLLTSRTNVPLPSSSSSAGNGTSQSVSQPSTATAGSCAASNVAAPSADSAVVHPATAPAFVQVSNASGILGISSPGSNVQLENLGLAIVDKSTIAASMVPATTVSSAVPPVPGYLVEKIKSGKFVDFVLLRPCNLKKLPVTEPNSTQLTRLLRSDLSQIRTFVDWAESWAVFLGVMAKHAPDKVQSLVSYFFAAFYCISGHPWVWLVGIQHTI